MISSPLLTNFPEIMHGFGSRTDAPPLEPLVTMKQIHGVELQWIQEPQTKVCDGYDGLISSQQGISLGVKTADCVPLLLYDPEKRLAAAVHAGWKGTVKKIVSRVVHEMKGKGSQPEGIRVAIGPCIRDCCFEVEHDVSNQFQKQFPRWREFVIPHPTDKKKWTIDLTECNQIQLREEGILAEHIDVIPLCTSCREDLFYSVRRDGDDTGRIISFIRLL